jgi:hypothetical protein
MFGEWVNNIEALSLSYKTGKPYENVVIPNFFKEEYAQKLYANFPDPDDTWFRYENPFEGKYLKPTIEDGIIKDTIDELYSDKLLAIMSQITGIDKLESDPHLNAGGLHAYTRNDMSGIHLDYTIHPITGKERRTSLMIYLSKDWQNEWGGSLSMWDENLDKRTPINCGLWNQAILFRTNGLAYHGFPEPIKCPEGQWRKVIGIYYMTDPTPESLASPRKNAQYFPTPGVPISEQMARLYEIRKTRRLEPSDLSIWPTWREECGRK